MAYSFQEKFDDTKLNRSLAVNAKVSIVAARANLLEEDTWNDDFLHGDETNIGVNDLIWYWLKERRYEYGDSYSMPYLGLTLAAWRTNYKLAMSRSTGTYGDIGLDTYNGFYPPNENGVGSSEMNLLTPFLNYQGRVSTATSANLITYSTNIITAIGDTPSVYPWELGDTLVSDYIYGGPSVAIDAAEIILYGDSTSPGIQNSAGYTGTGLLGRRFSNNLIDTDYDGSYRYTIGKTLTIYQPNFFEDTEEDANLFLGDQTLQTDLLSNLNALCELGDSSSTYQIHLRVLRDELLRIEGFGGDTNSLFQDPDMASDTGDSAFNVDTLLNDISIHIGNSVDLWAPITGDSTLWGFYNYFNGDDGTDVNFNSALIICRGLTTSLYTILNIRYTALGTDIIGEVYSTSESDFTLSRFWRLFWVKTRINKPNSSLLAYTALGTAITDANKKITIANTDLQFLMGDDLAAHLAYIPTPNLLATYANPKRNQDTGDIVTRKVELVYDGQQHAFEYWIYRQTVPVIASANITNDQWSSSYVYAKFGDSDEDSGFVKRIYTDWNAAFAVGNKYSYRVRTMDYTNTVSGDTTASDQSNIFDSTAGVTFTSITGDSILEIGDSHDFRKNNYIVINDTPLYNGYYLITRIEDTRIYVSPSIPASSTGTIYYCSCVVFIED